MSVITVRLPTNLHGALKAKAREQDRSLNLLCVETLASAVGIAGPCKADADTTEVERPGCAAESGDARGLQGGCRNTTEVERLDGDGSPLAQHR